MSVCCFLSAELAPCQDGAWPAGGTASERGRLKEKKKKLGRREERDYSARARGKMPVSATCCLFCGDSADCRQCLSCGEAWACQEHLHLHRCSVE